MTNNHDDQSLNGADESGVSPGEGEQRAVSGFQSQYRIAAGLILRALRNGALEWVRLADPEAGRVDDLQLASAGRLDAYQIKWSRYPTTLTFRGLTRSSGSEGPPSLFRQLVRGWQRLQSAHPDRRVVVHLVTNDQPSTSDVLPEADSGSRPAHFAAFLAESWFPFANESRTDVPPIPEACEAAWAEFVDASGLSDEEFRRFVGDCRLELGASLPEYDQATAPRSTTSLAATRERRAWMEDLESLNSALFRIVAEPEGRVELSKDELLSELGWRHRTQYKSRHEFPDPPIPYEEITETAEDLREALQVNSGGYIVLLGSPGSGKSTLLSRALRYSTDRVVRYYAYIPDSPERLRGESTSFLHDIVLSLDRQGFSAGEALNRPDLELLSSRLDEQLDQLGEDYRETGRKTFIVVDGLDHIERESDPTRSLLEDLPPPDCIPDGVYVVLGTQTDQLTGLPSRVVSQIDQPSRRLEMGRLSRDAVLSVIEEVDLGYPLNDASAERVAELSEGHPLALAYIIRKLRECDEDEVESVLSHFEPLGGEIETHYLSHWMEIDDNRQLVRLLAKLARIRNSIDIEWVETWADEDALHRLHTRFSHYFREEPDGRWYFFHNSFRAFILERTRELPGVSSTSGDEVLFAELGEHCSAVPEHHPVRWDEIYYFSEGGDPERVLEAADSDRVRSQFFAGRPPEQITDDSLLAIPAAAETDDVVQLVRLVLTASEFQQRAFNLDEFPVAELLLAAGHVRPAVDHLRIGSRLQVDAITALELCPLLASFGLVEEAERVFDLAEPLEALSAPEPIAGHEGRERVELLEEWVAVAPQFRSLSNVLNAIDRLRRAPDNPQFGSPEQATRELRNHLRYLVANSLWDLGRIDDVRRVISDWDPSDEGAFSWWFWAYAYGWRELLRAGNPDKAREVFRTAIPQVRRQELSDAQRVIVAEGLLRLEHDVDAARREVEGIQQPDPVESPLVGSSRGFAPYAQRFRLNRMLAALGNRQPATEVVPEWDGPGSTTACVFERLVTVVGGLYGRTWSSELLPSSSFVRDALPVLRFVGNPPGDDPYQRHLPSGAVKELHGLLIRAARLNGRDTVERLFAAYEREWDQTDRGRRWPANLVRSVVDELGRAGADRDRVRTWLTRLEQEAFESDYVAENLDNAVEQFRAYLQIGEDDDARRVLRRMFKASLGVGEKDPQFSSWIDWGKQVNESDPESGDERIAQLAACLPEIQATEGSALLAATLIRHAADWDLNAGYSLLGWSLDQGIIDFDDALEAILESELALPDPPVTAIRAVYTNFLLPLATSPTSELAHRLSAELAQGSNPAESLTRLSHQVQTKAFPRCRGPILKQIDEVANSHNLRPWSPVAPPDVEGAHRPGSSDLEYFDGGPQTVEGVRSAATSLDAVRELVEREESDSHFAWHEALTHRVPSLSRSELSSLIEVFEGHRREPEIYAFLARQLAERGDREDGWRLAERALNSSRRFGWREQFGDERLVALEALCSIRRERGRRRTWRTLFQDLRDEQITPASVALELRRIVPLLVESVPTVAIWNEISSYLDQLVPRDERPDPPAISSDNGSSDEGLLEFAAGYFGHAAPVLEYAAQRTFIDLLLTEDEQARAVVRAHLRTGQEPTESLLVTLVAVAEADGTATRYLADEVQTLNYSMRMDTRIWARTLLQLMGWTSHRGGEGDDSQLTSSDLPPIYRLSFQSRGPALPVTEADPTEPLPPTTEVERLVEPYRGDLDLIAEIAELQPEALYRRVVQLAGPIGTSEEIREAQQLRSSLESMGLKLPFRRPRARAVRRALVTAVAELADAEELSPEAIAALEPVLRSADPTTLRLRPEVRPTQIPEISEREDSDYLSEDWTESANTTTSAVGCSLLIDNEERFVLAEETRLRWLDWKRPTEVRMGSTTNFAPNEGRLRGSQEPLAELCETWSHVPMSEYGSHSADREGLVVLQNGYRFETPIHRWLAFNPLIARELGWQLDENGLLRWTNADGQLMVESFYWEDGFYDQRPPYPECEVGWGWLVVSTIPGWEEILSSYESLLSYTVVERTANDQGDERSVSVEVHNGPVGGSARS